MASRAKAFLQAPALCLLAALLLPAGCAAPLQPAPPMRAQEPGQSDGQALYEDAARALLAGRPQEAAQRFGRLADGAPDPLLRRRARYGQAAALLAAASTPAQAQEALAVWEAWRQEVPAAPAQEEDPRLLAPLLKGWRECLAARQVQAGADDPERTRARLARLQEENQVLRKQLSELEALHRDMLKRKSRLGR